MRALNTNDAFEVARALDESGVREDIEKKIVDLAKAGKDFDVESIGVGTIMDVVRLFLSKGMQGRMYQVLSGPYEMTPEEVGLLSLKEQAANIRTIAADEGLHDFFVLVSEILGWKPKT